MSAKSINFDDKKKIKINFYENRKVAKVDDVDVKNIFFSKEEPYRIKISFKYFIGCNGNDVIRPLCIKLSQMTHYVTTYEGNTTMSFKIREKQVV